MLESDIKMGDTVESDAKLSDLAQEFVSSFTLKKELVQSRIDNLTKSNNVAEEISQISKEIQKLSKSLHDVIIFLPSYSIKKRQEDIRVLESRLLEQENILIPKKKFGFRQKFTNGKPKSINAEPEVIPVEPERNGGNHEPTQVDSNFFTIESETGDLICKGEEKLNGNDVLVRNLEGKVIRLDGTPSTLRIANLKNCILACGPVHTSVFIENCNDCKFYLCCHQLRTHSSHRTDIYLNVRARAIIEDCTEVRFGPYNYEHSKMNEWLKNVDIVANLERYDCVDDFNWLSSTKSPNWSIIPEQDRRSFNDCNL